MLNIARQTDGPVVKLAFLAGGRRRELVIGRWMAAATCVLLLATIVWSLLAGFYVAFHDQLTASLVSRQADMQYGYEDQIATLRTELDRATSRILMDRRAIDTSLRDLAARSGQLELHAAAIDKLVAMADLRRDGASGSVGFTARPDQTRRIAPPESETGGAGPPSSVPGPALRLGTDGDRAGLEPSAIAHKLALVEAKQLNSLVRLRDPLVRATHRLGTALAEAGLTRRMLNDTARDVGGPFIPLPADERRASASGFDREMERTREALDQHGRLSALVDRVPLRDPLDGPIEVSSSFGERLDPFLGRPALHTGIDLRETASDAVHATAAGIVTIAGPNGGYGNMVEIDHGNGLVTRYAHLAAVEVTLDQKVATGATIGRVGSSGRATGPHLHYETRVDGEPIDPATFLIAGRRLTDQ